MNFITDFVTYRGLYKTINTDKLNVPSTDGRRTILSNHMPIVMALDNGVIETLEDGKLLHYVISEGVLYFENNKATIVCDNIINVDDVDLAFYTNRIIEIEKELKEAKNEIDSKIATLKLHRTKNLVEAVNKIRK